MPASRQAPAPRVRLWRSLGFRLSLVVVLAVMVGVTSTVGFFVYQDFRQTVTAEENRLKSSAAAFAAAASNAIAENDRRGTLEVRRGIRDLAHVRYASAADSEGRTVHHLLDAATGRPIDNGIAAVTIVAAEAWWAEALTKAVFAAGLADGLAQLVNASGVIVDVDGGRHATPDLWEALR